MTVSGYRRSQEELEGEAQEAGLPTDESRSVAVSHGSVTAPLGDEQRVSYEKKKDVIANEGRFFDHQRKNGSSEHLSLSSTRISGCVSLSGMSPDCFDMDKQQSSMISRDT